MPLVGSISSPTWKLKAHEQHFSSRPVTFTSNCGVVRITLITKMVDSRIYSPANMGSKLEFLFERKTLKSFRLQFTRIRSGGPHTTRRDKITNIKPARILIAGSNYG